MERDRDTDSEVRGTHGKAEERLHNASLRFVTLRKEDRKLRKSDHTSMRMMKRTLSRLELIDSLVLCEVQIYAMQKYRAIRNAPCSCFCMKILLQRHDTADSQGILRRIAH